MHCYYLIFKCIFMKLKNKTTTFMNKIHFNYYITGSSLKSFQLLSADLGIVSPILTN